ncbi:MAG: hypothetical protein JWO67_1229, partial [Streptosporangiaceae bacterium]|nr:hypothetical protein [Streptosporangiaceae bacterium]
MVIMVLKRTGPSRRTSDAGRTAVRQQARGLPAAVADAAQATDPGLPAETAETAGVRPRDTEPRTGRAARAMQVRSSWQRSYEVWRRAGVDWTGEGLPGPEPADGRTAGS